MDNKQDNDILIGNSFPFSLIRRDVRIRVLETEDFRRLLARSKPCSFWGHGGTRAAAERFLGCSLAISCERPALVLSDERRPVLGGREFSSCFVCSPDCRPGHRPALGEELCESDIVGWHVLEIKWN